jgi:hypothetical protein
MSSKDKSAVAVIGIDIGKNSFPSLDHVVMSQKCQVPTSRRRSRARRLIREHPGCVSDTHAVAELLPYSSWRRHQ